MLSRSSDVLTMKKQEDGAMKKQEDGAFAGQDIALGS